MGTKWARLPQKGGGARYNLHSLTTYGVLPVALGVGASHTVQLQHMFLQRYSNSA